MNPVSDFMDKAKSLKKNPLGIIALFISMIYGFACLVLSTSINNIHGPQERLPLIWFLIGYPILILIAFIYLVVFHHEKLYAPSDFKDESNFIMIMDRKKRKKRIQNEVDAIKEEINEDKTTDSTTKGLEFKTTNLIAENEKTIENKYLTAERFALSAFGKDRNLQVKRQYKIVGPNKKSLEFDGVAYGNGKLYGLDVKLTRHRYLSKILRQRLIDDIKYYTSNNTELNIDLVFIIVTESDNYESLERELQELIADQQVEVDIIVYNLNYLKKRFC